MSEKKFPERCPYKHEIDSQEDLNFLVSWLKVLEQAYPEIRGKINGYSISLTGTFVGIDSSGTLQICKVEGWVK